VHTHTHTFNNCNNNGERDTTTTNSGVGGDSGRFGSGTRGGGGECAYQAKKQTQKE